MRIVSDKTYSMLNTNLGVVMSNVATLSRRFLASKHGVSHDDGRDVYTTYGYDRNLTFSDFFEVYQRQDIAARIVNSVARSCWRDGAKYMIGEDQVLEAEMRALVKVGLFKMMERADILNRIGRYSILFVGVPDGNPIDTPVGRAPKDRLDRVFFAPFAYDGVVINKWETDPTSHRFGQPVEYNLQIMNRGEKRRTILTESRKVHWTRVIHLSEGALDGGLEGIPALEPVMNRLVDLNKAIGGASEAYFRNARGKYSLETEPGFSGGLTDTEKTDLDTEVEAFTNSWKDAMRLSGVSAKVLTTQHADPVGTVRVALQAIAGSTGIPIRILTGEGAGQLAGNEDKESYNQLISDRQNLHCEDWLGGVFSILENAGMLDVPSDATIDWPVASALNERDVSDIRMKEGEAFNHVMSGLSAPAGAQLDVNDTIEKVLGLEITENTSRPELTVVDGSIDA